MFRLFKLSIVEPIGPCQANYRLNDAKPQDGSLTMQAGRTKGLTTVIIPSPAMANNATVLGTEASEVISTIAPNRLNAQRSILHEDYLRLVRAAKANGADVLLRTDIVGGWQAWFYQFPDGSVMALYTDYGYEARPNKFSTFAIPTSREHLLHLTT